MIGQELIVFETYSPLGEMAPEFKGLIERDPDPKLDFPKEARKLQQPLDSVRRFRKIVGEIGAVKPVLLRS